MAQVSAGLEFQKYQEDKERKAKFVEQVVQVGQKMIAKCTEGKAVLLEVTSIDLATLAGGDGADESKAEVAFGPKPRGLLNKKTTIVLEAKRGDMKLIGDDRAVRRVLALPLALVGACLWPCGKVSKIPCGT